MQTSPKLVRGVDGAAAFICYEGKGRHARPTQDLRNPRPERTIEAGTDLRYTGWFFSPATAMRVREGRNPPYPKPVQPSPTWGRLKPAQSLPGISHLHCIPPRQRHASPSPFPNHQYSTATRRHLIHQYSTATLRRRAAIRPPISQLPPPQPTSCIPFSITSTIVLPFQLHLS